VSLFLATGIYLADFRPNNGENTTNEDVILVGGGILEPVFAWWGYAGGLLCCPYFVHRHI